MSYKILNAYAGIGGNRKLWQDATVTAVEKDESVAKIYKDFFPEDNVIIADAHQYILDHHKEFDFIWSSPPCPSHSRMRMLWKGDGKNIEGKVSGSSLKYPDMKLYEEIIFLKHFFDGLFCVENVISYYKPLIPPIESASHYFWTNFYFKPLPNITRNTRDEAQEIRYKEIGFDLAKYSLPKRFKRDVINNCVEPELGLHILNEARNLQTEQPYGGLFGTDS